MSGDEERDRLEYAKKRLRELEGDDDEAGYALACEQYETCSKIQDRLLRYFYLKTGVAPPPRSSLSLSDATRQPT